MNCSYHEHLRIVQYGVNINFAPICWTFLQVQASHPCKMLFVQKSSYLMWQDFEDGILAQLSITILTKQPVVQHSITLQPLSTPNKAVSKHATTLCPVPYVASYAQATSRPMQRFKCAFHYVHWTKA